MNETEYVLYFNFRPILTESMGLIFLVSQKERGDQKAHTCPDCPNLRKDKVYEFIFSDEEEFDIKLCDLCFKKR